VSAASSPLVTIGVPVYNSERYLRQSLDSLLAQTHTDFVLVISDNASTDGTAALCKEYVARDARVRYYRNDKNLGNPGNFNRIYELTTTPYLKWSTSDDYWAPTFLERALEVMERDRSLALCFPQATLVDARGENPTPYDDVLHLMDPDPAERFLRLIKDIRLAHQHLGVVRMSYLAKTHLLSAHVGSDINLLAELSLYGKFYELPERLYFRRFHRESGSWKRTDTAHQAKHYLGTTSKRERLRTWRSDWRHFTAVGRAPLKLSSKFRIYRYLAKVMFWQRTRLVNELRHAWGPPAR
jgi:glycosyltransferase involved in cell wall biosynthesis